MDKETAICELASSLKYKSDGYYLRLVHGGKNDTACCPIAPKHCREYPRAVG